MKFAHILGAINGRVLLFIFYFLVVSVYSIIKFPFNFFGKKSVKDTYWVEKNIEEVNEEILLRQF